MKQSPKKPTDDFQILMCMCSNAQCAQENTNIESSCYIGCRKNENERCPFEGYPIKKCTCPICCCNCNKAYEVSDIQRISIKLAQAPNSSESHVSQEVATSHFLGTIITNSIISSEHILASQSNISNRDLKQTATNTFFDCTANNIARMGSKLQSSSIQHLAKGFGTNTQVKLPNGETFDTRSISKHRDFHKKNNNLPNTFSPLEKLTRRNNIL